MKKTIITLLSSLTLIALICPGSARACEHEAAAGMKSAPAALPGGSLYQLPSVWRDQNGKTRQLRELAGRPRLVAMVFTRCQTACPLLVAELRSLDERLEPAIRNGLAVDLFSFDSERETVDSLQKFMAKYKLDESRWSAYSSAPGGVAELAGALGIQYKRLDSGDFIHANVIFLLNAQGEIVAKKEGLSSPDDEFLKAVRKELAKP